MRILVTGAKGFVGKNLCYALNSIKDGKDRTRPDLKIDEVYEYDIDSTTEQLDVWCQKVYGGELRLCLDLVGYTQEAWEQMPCDAEFEPTGIADRPLW